MCESEPKEKHTLYPENARDRKKHVATVTAIKTEGKREEGEWESVGGKERGREGGG